MLNDVLNKKPFEMSKEGNTKLGDFSRNLQLKGIRSTDTLVMPEVLRMKEQG